MRTDNEKFFLEIHTDLAEPVFRHCYIRVSDREKAKDLTQETFIKVWKFIQGGGEIKSVKAFVYKTANNLIIDEYRKRKTESLDELEEKGFEIVGEGAGAVTEPAEVENALKIISKLEPKYKDVLLMRFVDDLAVNEIAQIIGETENAISVKIHRGIKKVRELLKVGSNKQ